MIVVEGLYLTIKMCRIRRVECDSGKPHSSPYAIRRRTGFVEELCSEGEKIFNEGGRGGFGYMRCPRIRFVDLVYKVTACDECKDPRVKLPMDALAPLYLARKQKKEKEKKGKTELSDDEDEDWDEDEIASKQPENEMAKWSKKKEMLKKMLNYAMQKAPNNPEWEGKLRERQREFDNHMQSRPRTLPRSQTKPGGNQAWELQIPSAAEQLLESRQPAPSTLAPARPATPTALQGISGRLRILKQWEEAGQDSPEQRTEILDLEEIYEREMAKLTTQRQTQIERSDVNKPILHPRRTRKDSPDPGPSGATAASQNPPGNQKTSTTALRRPPDPYNPNQWPEELRGKSERIVGIELARDIDPENLAWQEELRQAKKGLYTATAEFMQERKRTRTSGSGRGTAAAGPSASSAEGSLPQGTTRDRASGRQLGQTSTLSPGPIQRPVGYRNTGFETDSEEEGYVLHDPFGAHGGRDHGGSGGGRSQPRRTSKQQQSGSPDTTAYPRHPVPGRRQSNASSDNDTIGSRELVPRASTPTRVSTMLPGGYADPRTQVSTLPPLCRRTNSRTEVRTSVPVDEFNQLSMGSDTRFTRESAVGGKESRAKSTSSGSKDLAARMKRLSTHPADRGTSSQGRSSSISSDNSTSSRKPMSRGIISPFVSGLQATSSRQTVRPSPPPSRPSSRSSSTGSNEASRLASRAPAPTHASSSRPAALATKSSESAARGKHSVSSSSKAQKSAITKGKIIGGSSSRAKAAKDDSGKGKKPKDDKKPRK